MTRFDLIRRAFGAVFALPCIAQHGAGTAPDVILREKGIEPIKVKTYSQVAWISDRRDRLRGQPRLPNGDFPGWETSDGG